MMDLRLKHYMTHGEELPRASVCTFAGKKPEFIHPNPNTEEMDKEVRRLNDELYKINKPLITAMKK